MAIDYGNKRVGLAVTDENQIIASGLTTVPAHELPDFLKKYVTREDVELIVVGEPFDMQGRPSDASTYIEPFIRYLAKHFPHIPVKRMDERFTSKMALQTMRDSGISKKARQNKALVDTISATILLQSFMEKQSNAANQL